MVPLGPFCDFRVKSPITVVSLKHVDGLYMYFYSPLWGMLGYLQLVKLLVVPKCTLEGLTGPRKNPGKV